MRAASAKRKTRSDGKLITLRFCGARLTALEPPEPCPILAERYMLPRCHPPAYRRAMLSQSCAQNAATFARISSRMVRARARRSSWAPLSAAGSVKLQCKRRACPGNTGQRSAEVSSQTVITYEKTLPALRRSNALVVLFEDMSIPTSRITATASGCKVPGSKPALCPEKSFGQSSFKNASAIWLLALLRTQTNSTSRFMSPQSFDS